MIPSTHTEVTRDLSKKARALLETLAQLEPNACLHDYNNAAKAELYALGLSDWKPRGWAGIGIHITDKGRALLSGVTDPEPSASAAEQKP